MKHLKTIVFFGTHELAVTALDAMVGLDVAPRLVVTHPRASFDADSDDSQPHPVRDWAEEHGVDLAPSRHGIEPELGERIAALKPDLVLVVDYGNPPTAGLLEAIGCPAIEVQPSLLPKLRCAHALRAALSRGETTTGMSVMEVNEEPWCGPILFQEEVAIGVRETFGELLPRAREACGQVVEKALKKLDRAKLPKFKPQKDIKIKSTPSISSRHRRVPWSQEAKQVYNRLRAYSPPGVQAHIRYRPVEIISGTPMEWVEAPYGSSGTYLGLRQGRLAVLCGSSTIFGIARLRRPGEEPQSASQFANKEQLSVGDHFA
ncbi:MAG: hypothetical protein GY719_15940 [bacterium]|nr:hypothetical protein [bacterium]